MSEFKVFTPEKPTFFKAEEDTTFECEIVEPHIEPSKSEDFSPTLRVMHDGIEGRLSLPSQLESQISEMEKGGLLKRGMKLRITNLGKQKSKASGYKYYTYKIEYA